MGIVDWARKKSPWILHLNCGSCNNCDIEVVAALMPRFDIERFGILLKGTPRHADVLVCTGPVTRHMRPRMMRLYEQTPEPKFVLAVGSCALSGGVFRDHYNVLGGIDKAVPVDARVPGCPPTPAAIIYGVVRLLERI